MKVLEQQIKEGKKKIAIFYGAGHMSDFHRRLVDDLGAKLYEQEWLTAWDLERQPKRKSPLEMLLEAAGGLN